MENIKAKIQGILMNCSQKSVIGWAVEESDFEHVAEEIVKNLALCAVGNCAINTKEILNDALKRKANYSLHYLDYSKDTWTVVQQLTENRLANLLYDASIDKIRIEHEL